MPQTTVYILDLSKRSSTISPLLFGHNLEHTRSSVWQGLSAQLLRNRKFYGKPQRSGVALEWYAIGPRQTYFILEAQEAYTRRYSDQGWRRPNEWNEILCQRILNVAAGIPCGIGQGGLPLQAGKPYAGRLALRADQPVIVNIRIAAHAAAQPFYQTAVTLISGGWQEFTFAFTPPEAYADAHLQITFDQPANLYLGAVSLLRADNFYGMRPDVVALLKEMGCAILRWPGGNFAGDYRWQDGLLPVDRRAPLSSYMQMETLPHTRGYDCHEIGTDEFVALCRAIGAEPYLTINPAWESPDTSAAWVEYCNGSVETQWGRLRAERGFTEPYHVKYWSLGNEFGYGHMEGPNSAAAYVQLVRPHAQAMRAVDPSIELVASGIWSDESWFTGCLADLGDVLNHISHHHYTPQHNPARPQEQLDPSSMDDFRRVATTPAQVILPELDQLRAKIQGYAPAGRSIGIAFDEWNVWYAWYRTPGVVDGIHHASMLNMLCRSAADAGVTLGCFFQPVNEGAILVEPGRAYLSTAGKVFPLFKAHWGNTLLDLGPQDAQADLDTTASIGEKSGKLVVTLVNRSPQAEHRVRLVPTHGKLEILTGILLSSADFLPASDFVENNLAFTSTESGVEFVLPEHSVARIVARV